MTRTELLGLVVSCALLALAPFAASAETYPEADAAEEPSLEATVEQQRQVIEEQQRQLDDQERRLQDLEGRVESDPPARSVTQASRTVRLAISGHVNRAMNVIDDGNDTEVLHVDNNASASRVRLAGTGVVNDDLTVGLLLELAIRPNTSRDVSQSNQSGGDSFEQRLTEAFVESKRFGKLTIGRGFAASDATAEVDVSGTAVVAYATWSDVLDAVQFFDARSDTLLVTSVADAFETLDGLGRESRVLYDTPVYRGFQLSVGANQDDQYDTAIRWSGKRAGFVVAAAAGAALFGGGAPSDFRISGSISMLHEPSGLNLTLSHGSEERDAADDPHHYYAKVGWLARLFDVGTTAFAADYTRTLNLPTGDDQGHAVGVACVQSFRSLGAEVYTQYRWIDLDRNGANIQILHAGTVGVRVKF